jgi:hypothetical protein
MRKFILPVLALTLFSAGCSASKCKKIQARQEAAVVKAENAAATADHAATKAAKSAACAQNSAQRAEAAAEKSQTIFNYKVNK